MDKTIQKQQILDKVQKDQNYGIDAEQAQQIDQFISKNRNKKTFCKDTWIKTIIIIQKNAQETYNYFNLKQLQLLRFLTKPLDIRIHLEKQFLNKLNERMPEVANTNAILIQILALHLRFVQIKDSQITNEMLSRILDLLALNNPQTILVIIEITRQLNSKGFNQLFEEIWYVGRLIFALERLQIQHKPKLINLIKDLLDCTHFSENFRRINGVATLINQLRKSQSNLLLKLSLFNCLYKLLLTTKTQVIYDFKINNFTSMVNVKLRQPMNFKQMILSIKIVTHLMLDNDLNSKYVQQALVDVIILLVRSHPTNCHMIKFEDIEQQYQLQAFQQFQLLLFRLLRYICSLQKHKKIFKKIFPFELLGLFLDVGHFCRPLNTYTSTLKYFNSMKNTQVLTIQDQFEKLDKIMSQKQSKLQIIGSYSLIEQIGQGAFGCVYLAKKGNNQYALKRIQLQANHKYVKQEDIEQYYKEVKIYKTLKHPNIVNYFESFIQDQSLYIVMEVVKGCNLSELIRTQHEKGISFEEDTVWRIGICLMSVLQYLHGSCKIIHRDLNPSNIMVDNKLNMKVVDFGLAKNITHSLNGSNSFIGTLVYSPPEILQNQPYCEKADIWSLGCILYQLMTLTPPFTGNNPLILAKNILDREFVAQLPNKYSEQLRNIVLSCLTPDRQKRPSVKTLLQQVIERVITYTDQLRTKQCLLNQQIVQMNRKINSGGLSNTQTRVFGNSTFHQQSSKTVQMMTGQDFLKQTQIVKLDSESLNKIGQDPMGKFIDIVKKLSLIATTQTFLKKNFKKYIVDTFYNRVIISDEFKANDVKNQLNKLINLSKEEVSFLGVKFELKQKYIQSITYEMLYFYIEELHELIKK